MDVVSLNRVTAFTTKDGSTMLVLRPAPLHSAFRLAGVRADARTG